MAERKEQVKQRRNPEKSRQKLLKAAGQVLVEEGLYGFHVHAIAKKAGMGKPLLYRYFGDRGQVLDALALNKAEEVESALKNLKPTEGSKISPAVQRQIGFARLLAGDQVLRGLLGAALTGELGRKAAKRLDDLIPKSDQAADPAAEAFLLAGISYVLLLKDSQGTCAGVPIKSPNDMAAFERAFVSLSSQNTTN